MGDLTLDTRPRCDAEGRYEGGPIPCDLHAGHKGPHEWYGPYDGSGGKTWRQRHAVTGGES